MKPSDRDRERARELVCGIGNSNHGLIGYDDMWPEEMNAMITELSEPIAQALADERERAARVAEEVVGGIPCRDAQKLISVDELKRRLRQELLGESP